MTALAAVRTEFRQGTPAWVDARRDVIGSSDISIITGASPYATSLFSLWAIKTRLVEPDPIDAETQELFDLGHALEPVIADQVAFPVRRVNQMLVHREIPWAAASLDRLKAVKGERVIVECKWVPHRHWIDTVERVPSYVQDQVQWQMFVTGYREAVVAVLNGSHIETHEISADDGYQENLLFLATWFRGLVERGERPPIDGSEATRRTLLRLHPRDTLGLAEPTAALEALTRGERRAAARYAAADKEQKRLRNALINELQEYAGVDGGDWRVSFKKNADSTKAVTDWSLVAASYREALQRLGSPVDLDAIESLYTTTVTKEGARPLLARVRDEGEGTWS